MTIDGKSLTIDQLVEVARQKKIVILSEEVKERIRKGRSYIEKRLKSSELMYGINTGFGEFSNVAIPPEKAKELQINFVKSHSAGTGKILDTEVVRAMMLLRANTLARGNSGIRLEVVELLCEMLNKNNIPAIPEKGSVGASGDLAPLAHLALALINEGLELKEKEGLALVNGTQLMTALGALAVYDAQNLVRHADIATALSTDVLLGSTNHTDPLIHQLRPFAGQKKSAENIRKLMEGSKLLESHGGCHETQDAYSLRCAPQVHGAIRDTIAHVHKIIETEMNSVTDNPLIFPEENQVLSGGNFHGEPVALAMDFLAIAMAELANISERRITRLTDSKLSNNLPAFLIKDGGLNSGLMIAQYTAASLVSENKTLAHPASVDSIPTCASKEDHVSMGTIGARHCREIIENTTAVLAIELMCAAQALDLRYPLTSSQALETIHSKIRKYVAPLYKDRVIHYDIEQMIDLVKNKELITDL